MPGHEHASRLALSWAADVDAPRWRHLDGTAVLADLAGFTRLTERLTREGAEGVEILHDVLAACFATMLDRALANGGDVIGFAGDAALVWFDGDAHVVRAAESAVAMPAALARLPGRVTGGRRLGISVGVHTGRMTAVLAGREQRGLFVCGTEMTRLVALQSAARSGQVLASDEVAARIPRSWTGTATEVGVPLRRRGAPATARVGLPAEVSAPADELPEPSRHGTLEPWASLSSPAVVDVLTAGVASPEHRAASVGFVLVPGTDRILASEGPERLADVLDAVVGATTRAARTHGVDWLDVDVAGDGVKLLLVAGAPRATGDDEDRMLTALRSIVDTSPVPLRAGAQRGRVFSGPLGVPGRARYTVLGDAVNVAARALGFASDGEIVAADGMGVAGRSWVTAAALGATTVKNRGAPVGLWRVDAVAPAPRTRVDDRLLRVRDREREILAAAWRATTEVSGGVVEIVGEPGFGASELVRHVADLAGPRAVVARGDPYRAAVAFGVVADLTRELAQRAGARRRRSVSDAGDVWAWLARFAHRLPPTQQSMVPSVMAAVRGSAATGAGGRRHDDPRDLAPQVRTVLAGLLAAAAPRPTLFAIDDLDQVDDSSRAVLSELRAAAERQALLVVVACSRERPLFADRRVGQTVLVLDALDDDVARSFVADEAPDLRDDEVARIVAAGQGNPSVLAELAHTRYDGDLPDSLQRLAAAAIDALPAAARRAVREVATFGTSVALDVAASVLERPSVLDHDLWASATSIVRAVGGSRIEFRNEAHRLAAYESLPFRRRREVHAAIADHLAARPDTDHATLARHQEAAGRPAVAIRLAWDAALESKAAGALSESAELLDRVVRMARAAAPELAGPALVEQGETLAWIGDLRGAEAAYRAAGRRVRDPALVARLCHLRADLALTFNRLPHARRWIDRGMALTDAAATVGTPVRCHLLLDRSALHQYRGRLDRAEASASEALRIADGAGDTVLCGLAYLHLQMVSFMRMDESAVAHGLAAIERFEQAGHRRYLVSALINTGLTSMHLGDWDDALVAYERAADIAASCGRHVEVATAQNNAGFVLLRRGRVDEAERLARRSLRTFRAMGLEGLSGYATMLLALVAIAEQRRADATEAIDWAQAAFERLGDTAMVIDCETVRMELAFADGRLDDVVAAALRLERDITLAEVPVQVAHARVWGRAEVATGVAAGHGGVVGVERIEAALRLARDHRLPYDEYLCLVDLLAVADDRADSTIDRTAVTSRMAALATRLGVDRSERSALAVR